MHIEQEVANNAHACEITVHALTYVKKACSMESIERILCHLFHGLVTSNSGYTEKIYGCIMACK